jgi:hypothetical protein
MKNTQNKWSVIINLKRRIELKKLAAKMRRKGYTRIQLNGHGADTYSIDGFNSEGGVWIGEAGV